MRSIEASWKLIRKCVPDLCFWQLTTQPWDAVYARDALVRCSKRRGHKGFDTPPPGRALSQNSIVTLVPAAACMRCDVL